MKVLLFVGVAALAVAGQRPVVRITNETRPSSAGFQIGDRFRIVVTGTAGQSISVRTTQNGRTDWGPVIARTDRDSRWSTAGQFEKGDFGDWSEVWTVGGKIANPIVHFSVGAPCLEGGQHTVQVMSSLRAETCDTVEGTRTFATASDDEPWRTPDGRIVAGRAPSSKTAAQIQMELIESLVTGQARDGRLLRGLRSDGLGDNAGALISKTIGGNALSGDEARNVLWIIRAAFETPDRIPQAAKHPSATLLLLRNLADGAEDEGLKQEIAKTIAWVQAR